VERAVELSSRWAERCWKAHEQAEHLTLQGRPQALFGIVQGGMDLALRLTSLNHLLQVGDFPGFGIGGYSVGESHELMFETLAPLVSEHMPRTKPRYLMGVGNPTTLLRGIACGVDMYDCVLPTRTARMGGAFSHQGRLNLRNACHAHDERPLDEACGCPVCREGYSRAYVHHLVRQREMSASILLSTHNVFFLLDLMRSAREAIIAGTYAGFLDAWMGSDAAVDWQRSKA
jgi:queuine tRNA-ribosyltransferase